MTLRLVVAAGGGCLSGARVPGPTRSPGVRGAVQSTCCRFRGSWVGNIRAESLQGMSAVGCRWPFVGTEPAVGASYRPSIRAWILPSVAQLRVVPLARIPRNRASSAGFRECHSRTTRRPRACPREPAPRPSPGGQRCQCRQRLAIAGHGHQQPRVVAGDLPELVAGDDRRDVLRGFDDDLRVDSELLSTAGRIRAAILLAGAGARR